MDATEYFKWVRDIPYRIATNKNEQDFSCEGKHIILEKLLTGGGLNVRPRICEFRWKDNKSIPNEVISIPHDDRILHMYLEVKVGNRWCSIDASMDKGVSRVMQVNEWDGYYSTKLCVKPLFTYSPEESLEIAKDNRIDNRFDKFNRDFFKSLNEWLESVRQKSKSL